MDGWMDDRQMDSGLMKDGWTEEQGGEWTDRYMGRWVYGQWVNDTEMLS